jgi:hypothetical protein
MGHSVVVRLRLAAFTEQSGRCFYCDSLMWLDDAGDFAARHRLSRRQVRWLQATAEHLVAQCEGGGNAGNIAAACHWCNWMRHRRKASSAAPNPYAYRSHVRKRVAEGKWRSFGTGQAKPLSDRGFVPTAAATLGSEFEIGVRYSI